MPRRSLTSLFVLTACAFSGIGDPIEGSGTTEASGTSGEPTTTGETSSANTSADPSGETSSADTSADPSGETSSADPSGETSSADPSGETSSADTSTGEVHCTLKLDVLFLLARSEGMLTIQEKIRSAQTNLFAGLSLADVNVRIMVSDLDRVPGAEECEDLLCAQNNDDSCAPLDDSYPCDHSPDDCDVLYGASVTFPWGIGAANKDCGFGGEYLSTVDTDALACALTLGEGTQAVDFGATLENVLGATNEPCNNGFIRDDAKLLVVIASNSDDTSFGSASDWIATVSDLRPLDSIVLAQNTTDTPKIDEFAAALPFVIKGNGDSDFFSNAAALTLATYCK